MNTHRGWLVNRLFVSIMSQAYWECLVNPLFGLHYVTGTLVVSCQSSIYLYFVMHTHWECRVNRLFVSIMSRVLIESALPLSICLHYVTGTHFECLSNCLSVSIMSCILIWGILSIIYLSLCCHWYIGISYQSYIYLHYVMGTR